jgi:flagellar M-ring protein FliF
VAVLVNGVPSTAEDGTLTLVPRPPEELGDLRELVAAAVGIDEARGDTLTVKSLAFEVAPSSGSLSEPGLLQRLDPMQGAQILALLVAIALIALFVLRPILLTRAGGPAGPPLAQLPAVQGASRSPRVLTGEIDDRLDVTELQIVSPGETDTALPTDPVSRLRRLIEERQAESIEILRGWMEDREEKA